jgi:hypothetical protein
MSPQRTPIDPATIQHLREKAEAAEAAYELTEQSDKVAALLHFDEVVQELGNALMAERPPDQD